MTTTSFTNTSGAATSGGDSAALERYQYLLRTSSPDQIEQAHQQAFAAMTEVERREVLQALATTNEPAFDASATSLARAATRYEMQQPGGLQNLLSRTSAGASGFIGSSTGKTVLASLAAGFAGSMVWDGVTGGDGMGGRPGVLSRLLGLGRHVGGGSFGGGQFGGGGFGQSLFGQGGFGGPGQGGPGGGGMFGGGSPGGGGPGGGFGGGPGGGGPGGF